MKYNLIKKTSSLILLIYSFFKKDRLIDKLSKETNFDKPNLKESIRKHPAYIFFKACHQIHTDKILSGYKLIEDFNTKKGEWNKETVFKKILEKDIISPCRVIGSFGNYRTVFNYLFNRINILKINSKPKIFIKRHDKINNKFLLSLFEPFIDVSKSSYSYYKNINNIFYFKAPIEISLPYEKKYYPWAVSENLIHQFRLRNDDLKFNFLKLKREDYLKGEKILRDNNLSSYKWYVALHIREDNQNDDQTHRNANPINYIKLIKEIISRGGAVFRMGNQSMTKLPKIKGLIDYPFTNFKSDFMDIFLAATSKFVVGTASGFWTAASFFNTPTLLTNYAPYIEYYSFNENCIFLPKTLTNSNNKIVSIKEIFQQNKYSQYTSMAQFRKSSLKVLENTEEDLLESVKNMFDLLSIDENKKRDFVKLNQDFKKKYFEESFYNGNKLKPLANFSTAFIKQHQI